MTMRILAVRTVYGEIIGRSASDQTDTQIEQQGFIQLEKPLMLMVTPIPTPQGMQMMNSLLPVSQFTHAATLTVPAHHIVFFDVAHEGAAKAYMEMTSGIALASAGSKPNGLSLIKP